MFLWQLVGTQGLTPPVPLSMEENSPSTGLHTEIPLLPRRLLENVTTTLFQVCHMSAQALESQKSSERVF